MASSWRNDQQPAVVSALREAGHEVYDFRAPPPDGFGFAWTQIDAAWEGWSAAAFREIVTEHPTAALGFAKDMGGLRWCDTCVLILPCGRSAHLELGWAVGVGKRTVALLVDGEPELMYRMVDHLVLSVEELVALLAAAPVEDAVGS